jgi:ORF6N domain
MPKSAVIPLDQIQSRIFDLRGHRVLLDRDLAAFYGLPTKALNQAVRRNADRFPADFWFLLTPEEVAGLKSQIVTSKASRGGIRKPPSVFTEHGALMAATVLNSSRAVQMSLLVIRAFVAVRQMVQEQGALATKLAELESRLGAHDEQLAEIIEAIRQLALPPGPGHGRKIGFHPGNR